MGLIRNAESSSVTSDMMHVLNNTIISLITFAKKNSDVFYQNLIRFSTGYMRVGHSPQYKL